MYDNIITGEENAFEDLELYYIDDSVVVKQHPTCFAI